MMKLLRNNREGFTLLELIVVIAIIGVLSSMTISSFIGAQKRGRDARRKAEVNEIKAAFEYYKADQGFYPTNGTYTSAGCGGTMTGGSGPTTYIQKMPCDPKNSTTMYTYSNTSPTTFTLVACLENTTDPEGSGSSTCGAGRLDYILRNP